MYWLLLAIMLNPLLNPPLSIYTNFYSEVGNFYAKVNIFINGI